MLHKFHPLSRYKANSGKNIFKNVKCILTLMLASLFSNLYLFEFTFPIMNWTNRLHDFDEGICFPDNYFYEIG